MQLWWIHVQSIQYAALISLGALHQPGEMELMMTLTKVHTILRQSAAGLQCCGTIEYTANSRAKHFLLTVENKCDKRKNNGWNE